MYSKGVSDKWARCFVEAAGRQTDRCTYSWGSSDADNLRGKRATTENVAWLRMAIGCQAGPNSATHMQLGKLGADDSCQQVEGKVGAKEHSGQVVDQDEVAEAIHGKVQLAGFPGLQCHNLQDLEASQAKVVEADVALQAAM